MFDQMRALTSVREVRSEFTGVPIVVQRGAIQRLDRAFVDFFRRCKSGEKPGYPRFRGRLGWDSILIDDLNNKVPICAAGTRIKVPLLGKIKFKQHRPLEGKPKALRLKLDGDGHWYVIFACIDVPAKSLSAIGREVGIDLGLTTFAATSDSEIFNNPYALKTERLVIERAQRRVSRRKRGSQRRRQAVWLLRQHHSHIVQIKRQHAIDVANSLVRRYDLICVEALNIIGLARGMLAKQVSDAGWGIFLHWLRVKAESAGREVIEVNPAGTSQICSECGCEVHKDLSIRIHNCPHCGYVADRDVNAAKNILRAGKALQGGALVVNRPRRSAKSKSFVSSDRITPMEPISGNLSQDIIQLH